MNSLNAFKYATGQLCQVKGWDKASVYNVWLLFTEEVGELASAIRQDQRLYKKTLRKDRGVDLESEMGDVFSYLFQLAFMLNIDLDAMWMNHYQKAYNKIYLQTTNGFDRLPKGIRSTECSMLLPVKEVPSLEKSTPCGHFTSSR